MEKIPPRVDRLPKNEAGYPVPWFVAWIDGKPDFRVMDENHLIAAVRHNLCWICGERMGSFKTFVIGPMCAVNKVSSEPPSHLDCAVFAAKACPFLINPKQKRRESNLPGNVPLKTSGISIPRNPGVALVWVTKSYKTINDGNGGVLFQIGPPHDVLWFAFGREATRDEVLHSIDTGLPLLQEMAEKDGPDAVKQLMAQHEEALELVPA